jgi:hypothetical protein
MVRRKTLKAADIAVLEHVARYRLTTPTILSAALNLDEGASEMALQQLSESGALVSGNLTPHADLTVCFQLSPWGAEQLGHDASFARPLSRDARIECFAIAQFCCCGETFRQLYTKAEFVDKFRALWHRGQPVRYYLEPCEGDRPRLAFLKVDTHGAGQWDRIIDSCARFLHQRIDVHRAKPEFRSQVAAFAELVRQGRFQFSILTALPEKQRAIEIELDRRQGAGLTVPPMSVYVVPGLWEIMVPSSEVTVQVS